LMRPIVRSQVRGRFVLDILGTLGTMVRHASVRRECRAKRRGFQTTTGGDMAKKLEIKDLTGKEVSKRDTAKVKGGTRVICYSNSASGGVKPK
jgi:hypothetical protein